MLNFKKITAAAVCCVLFTADTSGSSEKGSGSEASSASSTQTEAGKVLNFTAPEKGEEIAVLTIKDYGDIKIKLFPEEAEKGVENFTGLAKDGYYDNLIFHRVINDFMIQGGDPNGDGTGGPGYAIRGEFSSNGVENDLSHVRGVLSMARSSANDSAGSQFFIMHADSDYLDGNYAAFGMVLGGLDTVDVIASVPTDSNDKPRTEQVMRTVYVETYGKTYTFTKLED